MRKLFKVLLAVSFSVPAWGATYRLDEQATRVTFHAKGRPGFLNITGEKATATGEFNEANGKWSGKVVVNLKPITTGIDLRDEHMHEKYLETTKFPTAELTLSEVKVDGSDCEFKGQLKIKGVEKEVSGECPLSELSANRIKGTIEFKFDIDDYPVGVPSYLGITVADEVTIKAEMIANAVKETELGQNGG